MWSIIQQILTKLYQASFGIDGGNRTISNTSATGGNWVACQVLANAVISSITIDGATDAGIAAVSSHAAGTIIYGRITSITLASGTVRMYGATNINLSM
jgi:hypothetical protein